MDLDFEMGGFGIVGCFLEHFENDGPVHWGEFYGIAEQIGEYAFKVAYIADNGVVFNGIEFKFKFLLFLHDNAFEGICNFLTGF